MVCTDCTDRQNVSPLDLIREIVYNKRIVNGPTTSLTICIDRTDHKVVFTDRNSSCILDKSAHLLLQQCWNGQQPM